MVINDKSVILVSDDVNNTTTKYLIILQCKRDYGFNKTYWWKFDNEDSKIIQRLYSNDNITMSILRSCSLHSHIKGAKKEENGVLIISIENFSKYSGPIFSKRTVFTL